MTNDPIQSAIAAAYADAARICGNLSSDEFDAGSWLALEMARNAIHARAAAVAADPAMIEVGKSAQRDRGKMVKPKPGAPAGGYGGVEPWSPPEGEINKAVLAEKMRMVEWCAKRQKITRLNWERAARKALAGDMSELRNRIALIDAGPIDIVLSDDALPTAKETGE